MTLEEPPAGVDVAEGASARWREAHLDLLLAEELSVSPGVHLASRPGRVPELQSAAGRSAGCEGGGERLARHRHQLPRRERPSCHGEIRVLLIENKVWASLQPLQAERYRARADEVGGAAIVVAPRQWLDREKASVVHFDGSHSLEKLAEWLRTHSDADAARLAWRAKMLDDLAKPRAASIALDHEQTISFRDHCVVWLKDHASTAEASLLSLHTENQGWLWFRHPRDLCFKARNGTVDLYVGVNGFAGTVADLEARLAAWPAPAGFFVTTDTSQKRNVVLRHDVQACFPEEGVPADPAVLDIALDACRRITEWFDRGGATLLRGPAPTS